MVKGASLRRELICQTVEALGVEGFTDDPEVLVTAKFGILEAICAHRALRSRGPIRPEVRGRQPINDRFWGARRDGSPGGLGGLVRPR